MDIAERIEQLKQAGATANQLFIFNSAKDFGLLPEEMNELLHLEFNGLQHRAMLDAFKAGATVDDVKLFTVRDETGKPVYNSEQMEQIWIAREAGLAVDVVQSEIARPQNTAKVMADTRRRLLREAAAGEPDTDVLKAALETIKKQEENIRFFLKEYEELSEFIKRRFAVLEAENEDRTLQCSEMKNSYEELLKENEWLKQKLETASEKRTDEDMPERTVRKTQIPEGKLRKLIAGLDEAQLEQLKLGVEHGLTYEQLAMYASKEISAERMNNMRMVIETLNVNKGDQK